MNIWLISVILAHFFVNFQKVYYSHFGFLSKDFCCLNCGQCFANLDLFNKIGVKCSSLDNSVKTYGSTDLKISVTIFVNKDEGLTKHFADETPKVFR